MGSVPDDANLIVIVGETASGKSALALELAKQYDGEIICADSRTVYRGMDIGTAKPSLEDQAKVPHHLLDIVTPDKRFTAADFKSLANQSIAAISAKGKLPIMVGGTGLYVNSVLYDYQFSESGSERDERNPRHLKRSGVDAVHVLRPKTLVLGIQLERTVLMERIAKRSVDMMMDGLVQETEGLVGQYGWTAPGLNTIGYKELKAYLAGEYMFDEVTSQIAHSTMAYAKRQRTWFKRNKSIHWVQDFDQAKKLVQNFLSNPL